MAAITVELELAGGTWGGGIFASHRGIEVKNTDDLEDALHQIKDANQQNVAAVSRRSAPPIPSYSGALVPGGVFRRAVGQ